MGLTDTQFDEVVVDFALEFLGSGSLDDVDVLPTDSLLDLASRLSHGELLENTIARWYAEDVANVVDKLGVGVASKHNNVPNHLRCAALSVM